MHVEPDQLRLLALIDRHGSLTGAAHALGLTPAAVTQRVARWERDCAAPLVIRGARGARLTEAGLLLAAHGEIIEAETAKAAAGLAGLLGHLALRLRVGAFQAAALHLLPPALTALRHRHPDADVSVIDVISARATEQVSAGRLDVAVAAQWGPSFTAPAGVTVHPLLVDPMVVVLPDDHPLAVERPPGTTLTLRELRDASWVAISSGQGPREQLELLTAKAGFAPRVRFETESYDVAQALVASGVGVALVSRLALTHVPGTTHRDLAEPHPHRRIHAVTPADTSLTPLVGAFLHLLDDVARDLADTDTGTGTDTGEGQGRRATGL
ncbi:LysR family transcriptional regulator [Streptomyces sp. NPDC102364]|uniref:LysR family transcriptional regulator n=1 Tax=Streptomyces sp. NPDC102364 TaxID=3366161 RepID=UPI003816A3D8